jgi:ribosomal protein L40E
MVYCPKCGKENPDDAIFCMKCGSQLSQLKESQVEGKKGVSQRELENLLRRHIRNGRTAGIILIIFGILFGIWIGELWLPIVIVCLILGIIIVLFETFTIKLFILSRLDKRK